MTERARAFLTATTNEDSPSAGLTLADYLQMWFDSMTASWSKRTQEIYKGLIERHIIPKVGELPLAEITPLHIRQMLSALAEKGVRRTANQCRTLLFSALEHAVESDLIAKNPVKVVRAVRVDPKPVPVLEPHEMRQLLEAAYGHRLFPAFYLLVVTGLRRGELLGLAWSDLTPHGIHVRQALKYEGNKAVLGALKSKRGKRFVALSPDAIALLEDHKERQLAERATCGESWYESDLIFTSEIGTPLDPRNFLRTVKRLAKKAGVRDTHVHAFRHLHATQLIAYGLDLKSISDRLGHSSTSFTMDRYGHVLQEHRNRTALSIEQLLGPSTETPEPGDSKE